MVDSPAVPACKSGEYNPPPSVPHMDGKRAAPHPGRRVVFLGVCTCRAGPMCPAAGYAFFGGARGPRPTGQVRYPPVGDGVSTSRQRGSAALSLRGAQRRGNPSPFHKSPPKSQQFPTKFCAPIQNMKISPETVADGLRRCYIRSIHRKYTIYGHPWVSRVAAESGNANGILTKFYLHRRVLR